MLGKWAALWRKWDSRNNVHSLTLWFHEGGRKSFTGLVSVAVEKLSGEAGLRIVYRHGERRAWISQAEVQSLVETVVPKIPVKREPIEAL